MFPNTPQRVQMRVTSGADQHHPRARNDLARRCMIKTGSPPVIFLTGDDTPGNALPLHATQRRSPVCTSGETAQAGVTISTYVTFVGVALSENGKTPRHH